MDRRLHVVNQEEGLEDPLVEASPDEFALSAVGEQGVLEVRIDPWA